MVSASLLVLVVAAAVAAASGVRAGCPVKDESGARMTLYSPANYSLYEEQCGHYASVHKQTCCTKEDVWVDKLRLRPGQSQTTWDNNNGGCKVVSTECNDWLLFYSCGVTCSPFFTQYETDAGSEYSYRVCPKIVADIKENCKDDVWPSTYPQPVTDPATECVNFKDLYPNDAAIAADLLNAELASSDSDSCYNAAGSITASAAALCLAIVAAIVF